MSSILLVAHLLAALRSNVSIICILNARKTIADRLQGPVTWFRRRPP